MQIDKMHLLCFFFQNTFQTEHKFEDQKTENIFLERTGSGREKEGSKSKGSFPILSSQIYTRKYKKTFSNFRGPVAVISKSLSSSRNKLFLKSKFPMSSQPIKTPLCPSVQERGLRHEVAHGRAMSGIRGVLFYCDEVYHISSRRSQIKLPYVHLYKREDRVMMMHMEE